MVATAAWATRRRQDDRAPGTARRQIRPEVRTEMSGRSECLLTVSQKASIVVRLRGHALERDEIELKRLLPSLRRASATKQSASSQGLDCVAEPVIGPREARTRWLAMTRALPASNHHALKARSPAGVRVTRPRHPPKVYSPKPRDSIGAVPVSLSSALLPSRRRARARRVRDLRNEGQALRLPGMERSKSTRLNSSHRYNSDAV